MKQAEIEKICTFLLKKGFAVKSLKRSCFDILARNDSTLLLIKALEDANSITRKYSDEMGSVASYLNAIPLMVSEKAGSKLEANVIYVRYGVYTINFATLANCIENKFPFIRRSQAGLTASVIGNKLKNKREELGLSLNKMSKLIGVTSRMVMKYEQGLSEVTVNRAMRIYDILGQNVFRRINIFESKGIMHSKSKTDISKKYVNMGFSATDTEKAPFDIIAKKECNIIITEVGDKINPDSYMVSRLIDADNLVIFEKKRPKDIAAMTKKEFLEFNEADELIKFLKEF